MADETRELQVVISARDEATRVLQGFAGTLSDLVKSAQAGAALMAGGLAFAGKAAVQTAADLETARQGFATLLGSTEAADAALAQIKKDAASTPFTLPGLVSANQLLTQVTKNSQKSEGLLLNVGKALAAAGKGQPELDRVILNLQQIGNTAKITEMDVRQFGSNGINILELLADYYGVTKDKASDMVKESKDAFKDLEGAFAKAGEGSGKFARAFIDQAGTFNQLMSNFGDALNIAGAEIVKNSGLFNLLKEVLAQVIVLINQATPAISAFLSTLTENTPALTAIIGALVGLLTPLLVGFVSLIAPALLFVAAGMAIGAAIGWVIENIKLLEPYFPLILGAFAAIATFIIGTVVPAFVSWAIAAVTAAIATITALLPIILVCVAIGAAVALLAMAWQNNWGGIQEKTQAFLDWFEKVGKGNLREWIDLIKFTVEGMAQAWISNFNKIAEVIQKVIDLAGKVKNAVSNEKGGFKIPGFAHGGTVDGGSAEAIPAFLHPGERVIPRTGADVNNTGGGGVTINISGSFNLDSDQRIQQLVDKVVDTLGRQNELAAKGLGY